MKKTIAIVLALVMALLLVGCGEQPAPKPTEYTIKTEEITYTSRGVEVPATVCVPEGEGTFPLVVLCHGHGGDRNENTGHLTIAESLAKKGIITLRMDYPGCGKSTEDFALNTMSNMIADTVAGLEYAKSNLPVDTDKIGLFGYSMGGRIVLQLLAEAKVDPSVVVLLAPAADTDDLKNLFGGAENWETLKADANAAAEGYVNYTTIYGQEQHLSKEWFADIEAYAGSTLIDAAAKNYTGKPSLVIYAVDDAAVSPSVSKAVANALSSEVITTPKDGHSYGFYSEEVEVFNTVVDGAVDFFVNSLSK